MTNKPLVQLTPKETLVAVECVLKSKQPMEIEGINADTRRNLERFFRMLGETEEF